MASTRSPSATPLTPADLRWSCDPASLGFASTDELPPLDLVLGQDRAVQAIRFAMGMRHTGYNLFALGSAGVGKHHVLRRFLEEEASRWPVPDDWCYVHSLADENAPLALRLPPGEGPRLRDELAALVVELKAAIPAAFESEDYLNRRQVIHDQAEKAEDQAFEAVKQLAREHDLVIIRAPGGVVLAPVQNGEVMPNERFETLGPEDQKRIEANLALMHDPVNEAIRRLPALKKRYREAVLQLDQEVSAAAVGPAFAELRARWSPEEVLDWLGALERDVVANAGRFLPEESDEDEEGPVVPDVIQGPDEGSWEDLRRYRVNVLVSHVGSEGAPVVREDDPTLGNLLGRIEHVSTYGALSTDFTRIRPGALHRANGGFLVLDARRLLEEPMAWEHLKQALRHGEIRMPMPSANGGVVTAITLEPQPIPLELKVALVGDRALFYMLGEGDPQLGRLFKVAADFEDDMPRDLESVRGMARLLARLAREDGLRTLSADGVARVVEEAVRLAGDRRRLALEVEALADLLREADHFAGQEGVERTTAAQVDGALAARRFREGRLPDQARRAILDGTVHISTSGTATGEIVGLSVYELGRLSFGAPARISARVRLGEGEVLDIEDEVELSGAIHAKGVHLLEGFIGGRFGAAAPCRSRPAWPSSRATARSTATARPWPRPACC